MGIDNIDQGYAFLNEGLDDLVERWRASLGRKQERHGDKFDAALALPDLVSRLCGAPYEMLLAVASSAVDRLAKMPDFNAVPDELAALDYDPSVADLNALFNQYPDEDDK
jgi:hypothetical protein